MGTLLKRLAGFLMMTAVISGCSGGGGVTVPAAAYWPTQGWHFNTPEAQGFDSTRLAEAVTAVRDNDINLHSLMVIRNDEVILDAYFYPYDGRTVHELASVTKSVLTTLVGIAADRGELSLDDQVLSFFPDRTIANRSLFKRLITVRQLAAMASGLACTAENDEQTLTEMGEAEDWVQFTLDLETDHYPGTRFVYCSPGMHLLSTVLQEATGKTAAEYAREYLFEPLGIHDFYWDEDPQGYSDGWAGLNLHPHDVAKIGYLMLHGGQWEGRQIVSQEWVREATRQQIRTGMGDNYGFGWWVPPPVEYVEYAAVGRGGQYIRIFPELNLIVVTTGNGYEWNDIVPLLVPAMIDLENPLPANPDGAARLDEALAAALEPPQPHSVGLLPETAETVSGRTYYFEANPLNLKRLRFDFDETAEARLFISSTNQPGQSLLVGLDGVYRMAPIGVNGLPIGLRGGWVDDQTFLLEYDQIANIDAYSLEMRFEGERLSIQARERTHEAVIIIEGIEGE